MTEKYVLLKAKVMTEFEGQPYELEVRNASGLTMRVQPPDEDVIDLDAALATLKGRE